MPSPWTEVLADSAATYPRVKTCWGETLTCRPRRRRRIRVLREKPPSSDQRHAFSLTQKCRNSCCRFTCLGSVRRQGVRDFRLAPISCQTRRTSPWTLQASLPQPLKGPGIECNVYDRVGLCVNAQAKIWGNAVQTGHPDSIGNIRRFFGNDSTI